MDYRDALCKQIDLYFYDITAKYHETTVAAMQEVKKFRPFKKKDFSSYIAEFETYKEKALRLESMDIPVPDEDVESKMLAKDFRNSLLSFVVLCDANIVFYDWNQKKQYNEKGVTVKDYAEVVNDMQNALKEAVVDLDLLERAYKEYRADKPAQE